MADAATTPLVPTPQLATRCSACETAFRVVQDQLKVSEGWVRCGRCDTVFNALERLFDLQREPLRSAAGDATPTHDALPALPADDAAKPPLADAFSALLRARSTNGGDALAPPNPPPGTLARTGFGAAAAAPASGGSAAAAFGAGDRSADFAPAAFATAHDADGRVDPDPAGQPAVGGEPGDIDLLLDVAGGEAPLRPLSVDSAAPRAADGADSATTADGPTPEFIRAAERDARWRRPPVRWALAAASVLLLAALALQAAHHFRDGVAARWPAARPWLDSACGVLGCAIGPPHRIGDVTVESTALAPLGAEPGTFRLSVTLRNRGPLVVALPAVDLSLTDSNGHLVARRALLPAELSAGDSTPSRPGSSPSTNSRDVDAGVPVLRPDTDTRLQALLASEPRVVGYTVDLFYP